LLIRLIATAAALFVAVRLVPGIRLAGTEEGVLTNTDAVLSLLVVAVIFGLVNAILKPILKLSTCLINVATVGLFAFVINAFLLWLTSFIALRLHLPFEVDGALAALMGSIIISVVSMVLSIFIRDD
jgi:putative membrane protein